jgi:3-oxoacyl-[acyl-carrier-protein] synthase-1
MERLAITGCGMVTPAGLNAAASLAAIRAGVRAVNETNLWDPESGTYLAAGKVPLPQWWVGIGKLADLISPALLECFDAAKPIPPQAIPVLLGVAPSDRPFRLANLDTELVPEIELRLGFPLHVASRMVPRDRVSVAVALQVAAELISNGTASAVIVAGVDSLLVHDLKNHYLDNRRLLTPTNSNGFSLGEAGSATLVRRATDASGELQVLGVAIAREQATIESDKPMRGEGLTDTIRQALGQAEVTMKEVDLRITDLNGEHYRFKEMALATNRFARTGARGKLDLWHPIEYLGDVGAAIGPIICGIALDANRKHYSPGATALCTFGNDDGARAALILSYRNGGS